MTVIVKSDKLWPGRLPYHGTPYSPSTYPTMAQTYHLGPALLRTPAMGRAWNHEFPLFSNINNTYLMLADSTTDTNKAKSGWGDLLHSGTPYSPWTFPTMKHPTHHRTAPQNLLTTLDLSKHGKLKTVFIYFSHFKIRVHFSLET